jgi:DNA gyrase/topoisomerase IV subunit A
MAVTSAFHQLGAQVVDLTSAGVSDPSLELAELEKRLHVLEGLLDALGRLDQVNKAIQLANNRQEAFAALQQGPFRYSREQAKAVLEMPMALQCFEAASELRAEQVELARRASKLNRAAEVLPANWFG